MSRTQLQHKQTASLNREVFDYFLAIFNKKIFVGPKRSAAHLFVREGKRRMLPQYAGFAAPVAAYLAQRMPHDNPFFGRSFVLDFAFQAAERLVKDHEQIWSKNPKPNHFTIFPLATLYELTRDSASKKQQAAWREVMARNLKATDALIERCWATLGKPGPWAGTGPNHFFGWFAVAYHQAMVLEDERMLLRCRQAMAKHLNVQTKAGYFPEHVGPAVQYQGVSIGGVAEFHRLCPGAATLNALKRGVDFIVNCAYPDQRGIETFDERNRIGYDVGFQPALAWTPDGRAMLRRIVERRRAGQGKGFPSGVDKAFGEWWTLGDIFRCYEHCVAAPQAESSALPQDRARWQWRLEDYGLVRKNGPWVTALCALTHPAMAHNPYHYERSQALSIWHEKIGLIVGGGNDKRAPHAATIHVVEEGEVHYFPPVAGILRGNTAPRLLKGKARCDAIDFEYGCTQARLEVHAENAKRFHVGMASQSNMVNDEAALVFQLPLKANTRLKSGNKQIVLKPAKDGGLAQPFELSGTLELPGQWRMKLPHGSTLHWPHIPWSGYRPPKYLAMPDAAVALLRMPGSRNGRRVNVVIEV